MLTLDLKYGIVLHREVVYVLLQIDRGNNIGT